MIRISKDYIVDVDSLNYTAKVDLHKTITDKKTGQKRMSTNTIGYYGSLRSAVRGILAYDVKNNLAKGEKSLNEAIKVIDEANNRLEELLTNIPEEANL